MLKSWFCQKKSSEKLSLEQYTIVASFLNYENTVLVQRNSLYLLANATLLAPTWEPIHKLLTCTYSRQISDLLVCASEQSTVSIIVFGLSVIGLLLSLLWLLSFRASAFWLRHWHKHLRELESEAFGDRLLHRNLPHSDSPIISISATKVLKFTIYLFIFAWLLSVSFVFWVWNGFSPTNFMYAAPAEITVAVVIFLLIEPKNRDT